MQTLTKFSTIIALAGAICFGSTLPAFARPAVITAEDSKATINVRSQPNTYAKTVTTGRVGTAIEVLRQIAPPDQDYAWVYAKVGQEEGWIHAAFIEYAVERKTYGTLYGHSLAGRINVRSGPSTKGKILREGLPGDMVQVLRTLKGDGGYKWHSIQYADSSKGWIREDLIMIWSD
jgi:SH3-like domain-containing protein